MMITELVVLLAALCFVCIRTDFVRRGSLLVVAIVLWGLARLLTELNFERAQYDPTYTYGTMISYAAAFSLVGCVLFLFAACWQSRRKAPPALPAEDQSEPLPASDPSERLRELLAKDQ